MTAKIIDGKAIAAQVREKVAEDVAARVEAGLPVPGLAIRKPLNPFGIAGKVSPKSSPLWLVVVSGMSYFSFHTYPQCWHLLDPSFRE